MNYYQLIQKSIDYIEVHLNELITIEDCANEACMSVAHFYRMFFAITGFQIKEYIRLRRISEAAKELYACKAIKIIDLAVKYDYASADAFSRAFKKVTGFLPSKYGKQDQQYYFERINIMERMFDVHPDIKVLKELEGFWVAAYTAHSKEPENDAFEVLKKWALNQGLLGVNKGYRVFGFDVPNTVQDDGSYGFEVWMTIPESLEIEDKNIVKKYFEGGLYAVMSTTIGEIVDAWKRFGNWLKLSKYEMAGHQYLEEHSYDNGFANRNIEKQDRIKVDIYMPIALKSNSEYVAMEVEPVRVAYYREYGDDSEKVAQNVWNVMLSFARKQGLDPKKSKIYMYNHGFRKVTKYWHEIMITIENDMVFEDMLVKDKVFKGGTYMTTETNLGNLGNAWHEMGKWIVRNKVKKRRHQWVEQWMLNDFSFPENGIRIYYPINEDSR